ncbi:putative uncharacterized protein DDB_G0271982 [Drosophila grimshawi]|uniref:putative uncharacterized protein DDB_G0271982 n=1 Tax=Drosophila grimshawi TaxID=7222 RepID=UPI000C86EE10|nr:putative uncharacterized protein DDB_G0271982 [Drosophila grimshawi]
MSRGLYGLTSIYTRRQTNDVFHNDPFKIQSYNFRYADRPAFPMQAYQRPQPTQPKPPSCETYYKNPKFITRMSHNATVTPASTAFAEHRRRQFLHDFKYMPTMPASKVNSISGREAPQRRSQLGSSLPAAVSKLPLLRTCCDRDEYRAMRRDQSVTSLMQSASSTKSTQACASASSLKSVRNFSTSTFERSPMRSANCSSGCAININISGREAEAQQDNRLNIQIKKDNNTNNFKELARNTSSDIFFIDKRLSKFNLPVAHEQDLLMAVRQQGTTNQVRQQELEKEQQLMRLREQERELFRQLERLRDPDQLQAKREKQRQRDLECEAQRPLPMPMRAMPLTTSVGTPATVMTSNLKRLASKERLPGMVPFYVRQPRASSSPQAARAGRITQLTNRQEVQLPSAPAPASPCITLERRSSASSHNNANVCGSVRNASLQRLSNPHLSERKLLNLNVNGMSVDSNQPIHTRLNNMPIRITTSQPAYEDRQFSLNKVRVRNTATTAEPGQESGSCRLEESTTRPYNVSINVYADNLRTMRL